MDGRFAEVIKTVRDGARAGTRACTDDGAVSAKEYIVIEYFLITWHNERGARI